MTRIQNPLTNKILDNIKPRGVQLNAGPPFFIPIENYIKKNHIIDSGVNLLRGFNASN